MDSDSVADQPSIGLGGALLIGLSAIASAFGYLGAITRIISGVLTTMYRSSSHSVDWFWFLSFFLGMITTPIAVILAIVAAFLPVGKRTKIIICVIAVGGAVGWIIAAEPLLHHW